MKKKRPEAQWAKFTFELIFCRYCPNSRTLSNPLWNYRNQLEVMLRPVTENFLFFIIWKKKWSEIIRVIYRNTFKLLMALSYSVQLWLFLFSLFIMLNPSGIQNTWKKLCIRLYMWKCRSDRIASFALFLHQNGFKYVNTNLNIFSTSLADQNWPNPATTKFQNFQ